MFKRYQGSQITTPLSCSFRWNLSLHWARSVTIKGLESTSWKGCI